MIKKVTQSIQPWLAISEENGKAMLIIILTFWFWISQNEPPQHNLNYQKVQGIRFITKAKLD